MPKTLNQRLPIQFSVEILFLAVVFHAVICIPNYATVTSFVLGLVALFSSCNAWLTARAEFSDFKTLWFVFDLFIIFFYAVMPVLLLAPNELWGYSPVYWLMFAGVEFVYTLWNYLFSRGLEEASPLRENMRKWIKHSLFAVLLFLIIFLFLELYVSSSWFHKSFYKVDQFPRWVDENFQQVGYGLMALGGVYMLGMELVWNIFRYKSEVSTGHHYLIE